MIVTGMSGAGKTSVLKFLEDINFFCVDNIPPALLPKFAELCYEQEGEIERVAMGIDIRGGKLFNDLFEVLSDLQHKGYEYEILFLDARQAAYFVQTAGKFESEIQVSVDEKRINAKSIMGTIALNMQEGQTALITADGKDEAAAVEELAAVLA